MKMGCAVGENHIRTNRKTRSVKPDPDNSTTVSNNGNLENSESDQPKNCHSALTFFTQKLMSMSNSDPEDVLDDNGWGYCTEDHLEELLLNNLDRLYSEAINKLVGLGYDQEEALKAILGNGHCSGGMDVLTNILHNSMAYLNNGGSSEENSEKPAPAFADLRQLEEYSLAGMICLLQQVKPHLSKGDAMWCLLMSELHVGRARVLEIPVLPSSNGAGSGNRPENASASSGGSPERVFGNGGPFGVAPAFFRFHSGWGFGNSGTSEFPMNGKNGFLMYGSEMNLQRDIECPNRFNLSPSMKNLLRRNVAMYAAGFRANAKQCHSQSQACPSSLSGGNSPSGCGTAAVPSGYSGEPEYTKNQDVVNSVMSKFQDLNLDENSEQVSLDKRDEMILSLIHQLKDLEKQVEQRNEWAHEKAMQAARKVSHDVMELEMLRMEREETQRLKKGKQALEETTISKAADMENAERMASARVDQAETAVRRLEAENAEIRAEMEASKLSASESLSACLEVAKREKKCLKKLSAWEKQKTKMQEVIAAAKQNISELQQVSTQVEATTKKAKAKWRQARKAKEQALTQLEDEQHLKESAEIKHKRKLETLRLKIEIDFQRQKDDLQRLKQEYAHLKESLQSKEVENQSNHVQTTNCNGGNPQVISGDRKCMICMKDEVSVVFLPCTHEVICAKCNENYGRKGKAKCTYCRAPIEQRIRVYGAGA